MSVLPDLAIIASVLSFPFWVKGGAISRSGRPYAKVKAMLFAIVMLSIGALGIKYQDFTPPTGAPADQLHLPQQIGAAFSKVLGLGDD